MGAPSLKEDGMELVELQPQFHLVSYDAPEGAVDLTVSLPTNPDDRMASNALLFGMAIMTLNQDGTIEQRMLEILKSNAQPITQKAACEGIQLLLMEEQNDQVV